MKRSNKLNGNSGGFAPLTVWGLLTIAAVLCVLFIFGVTVVNWPGSFYAYGAMSLTFCGLLAVGVRHLIAGNVGFSLLAILLWVGYWLKLSIHLFFEAPWVEPIGRFGFSVQEWDLVAIVSATGALAVALVGLLWRFPFEPGQVKKIEPRISWKPGARVFAYIAISLVVITILLLNENYDISHNGLRPAVDLVWPLQGVFSWFFVIGVALLVLVVFHLDAASGNSLILATLIFVGAVTLLAVSQYSRGIAALQSLPLVISLLLWQKCTGGMSNRSMITILMVIFIGVMVSVAGGQERRIQTLPDYEIVQEDSNTQEDSSTQEDSNTRDFPALLSRLVIDRWVGLEGVMAVVAYPDKGTSLFNEMIAERRTKDKVDKYTSVISEAGVYDTSKYQFATIPGAFAFLYYSHSLVVVFFGAMFLAVIVMASEHMVRRITNNIFISSQVGFFTAMLFIQLGAGGIVQPASVLIFTLVCAILISRGGKSLLTSAAPI